MSIGGNHLAGARNNASELDCYSTPEYATEALMKRIVFEGEIWEPACGLMAMVNVLKKYNPVIATDIRITGHDFLLESRIVKNIVTNPPYNLAEKFVWQGLRKAEHKLALFLRLNFLEGQRRYQMFKQTPLKQVLVFCKRQTLSPEGSNVVTGGTIAYAWFIWERGHKGLPTIDWIND